MPRLNKELQAKGMLAMLPAAVHKVAPRRKKGYVQALQKLAIYDQGMYYLTPEDYTKLNTDFKGTNKKIPPQRKRAPRTHPDILQFLDLRKECPREDWKELRDNMQEELEALEEKGCSSCQLTGIKNKYKKILIKHV
jgi:hypothetical protein